MITTPEQMREAAALVESTENHPMSLHTWQSWIDDLPLPDSFDDGKAALQEYMQYLAFPIAPQPVAVTVKPLVWEALGAGYMAHDPLFQTTALARSADRCAEYDAERAARILPALTIHPADPLSDPRVKALVEACKTADTIARDLGWHRIYDATDAALRAIGGEA